MTKVLHVVEAFSGGIVQSIATICRALDGLVVFHVLHGQRPDSPDEAKGRYPDNVEFTPWRAAGRSISPLRDIRAVAELRAVVAAVRPDLIHAHSSKAGALARLAFPCGGLPVVYSPRGYSFLQLDKGMLGCAAFWAMERLLGVLPHITVGCGLGEYGLARRVASRSVLIPNMIEPNDFNAALCLRPNETAPLRIAMAGGIRPQKNFPLFCKIAAALSDGPMRFIWVGDGDNPISASISASLPPNMEITGWLKRSEVLRVVSGCHVYMQNSLWEGLPLAMLKAIALGLPVLAYPAIGNSELVIEGANGYLCPDAGSFIKHLAAFDCDRAALMRMGEASRCHAIENHAVDRIAQRWLSLYRHYERYRTHG